MIRVTDAFVLAYTKLRTHRVRTGVTVGLAGILFGVILAGIFFVQGVFDSVERFSSQGLSGRAILAITRSNATFNVYEHAGDPKFIAEVEAAHQAIIDKKTAAAKRYGVEYDAKLEDPSPVDRDKESRSKIISDVGFESPAVMQAASDREAALRKADTFDIDSYLKAYASAHVLPDNHELAPEQASLVYMKDGKEALAGGDRFPSGQVSYGGMDSPLLSVYDGGLVKPFISVPSFDPQKGEIPVVLPYSQAEKLLGFKPLSEKDSSEAKLERLHEVRRRVGEITAHYCYRNTASQQLMNEALVQSETKAKLKNTDAYTAPPLEYELPAATSCGPVKVLKDTRSPLEKQQATARIQYEKAIGEYLGEPVQHKLTLRAIGISGDVAINSVGSLGQMVADLLASNLGYNTWAIPSDLLRQVPEKYRPEAAFQLAADDATSRGIPGWSYSTWLVEFDDKDEARQLLQNSTASYQTDTLTPGSISAYPFGSGTLIMDDFKKYVAQIVFWALIIVGGVAAVILSGLIGRTISEGRRESAVFRAIGAKRSDIAGIYGMYAFLLALRVVLFAVVLGATITVVIELLYWRDATLAARLAYAATDTTLEFHLFSVLSWYVPIILGVIVATGVLGAVVPIIRNARRNPINDMRDE